MLEAYIGMEDCIGIPREMILGDSCLLGVAGCFQFYFVPFLVVEGQSGAALRTFKVYKGLYHMVLSPLQ